MDLISGPHGVSLVLILLRPGQGVFAPLQDTHCASSAVIGWEMEVGLQ